MNFKILTSLCGKKIPKKGEKTPISINLPLQGLLLAYKIKQNFTHTCKNTYKN
jgi:hypothetical protein